MDHISLRLSSMVALWGIVTPNTRKVSVQEESNKIILHFYYDEAPSEIEDELSEVALTEIIADCPNYDFKFACERHIIKSPEKINQKGYLIYSRFEGKYNQND